MIKVLEICAFVFLSGGIESFLVSTLSHMNKDGIEFDFFTPYTVEKGVFTDSLHSLCSNVYEGELDYLKPLNKTDVYNVTKSFLKDKKYDVIHIHSSFMSVTAFMTFLSRKSSEKVIVHCHGTDSKKNIRHFFAKKLLSPVIEHYATDYCACSLASGKCKYNKRTLKKLKVLKNGIDLDRFAINDEARQEYRKKLGLSDSEKVIGNVARFDDNKNQAFIVELLNELLKRDDSYRLLLIGDGITINAVKKTVKELDLCEKVIFTGNVSNVQDYMQAMDLFVFPSLLEGLGIVGIEAQGCGLQVIASTGVPEEMKITDSVEFVSLDDKDKWLSTIERLIKLPKEDNMKKIQAAGYDINQTAEEIRNIYFS